MRSVAFVALATVLFSHPLMAADMIPATPVAAPSYVAPAPPPPPAPIFYIGAGANIVHHTGYVPGTKSSDEKWVAGGKAFGGVNVFQWAKVEVAYFYLSKSRFMVTPFTTTSSEQSNAAAATVIVCCVWVHQWVNSPFKTGLFGRVGGAYKWINYRSPVATFDEGGVSYVLGFGAEIDVTSWAFLRFEYEYISKIISGTKNAVDVQHTPISASLGMRF
jgi:opacity protein-like surface antigen